MAESFGRGTCNDRRTLRLMFFWADSGACFSNAGWRKLRKATGCTVQHDGWTCGTCFYAIDDKLTNKDWQTVLYIRGDYELQDLDSLPKDMTKSVEKILKLCGK